MKYRIQTDFIGTGRYRSRKIIGKGAVGEVFLSDVIEAPDEGFPSQVAIKAFPNRAGFSAKSQKREIETMRLIKHPNVVELLDWGISETCHFMVFPYCGRGSLTQFLEEHGFLTPEQAIEVLRDMASGLSAIHERGLLHLDLKPANILLGDDGRFVLSDLGIASFQFLESRNVLKGTPLYMSPEQARGEVDKLDARTDLFSLGAALFYALQDPSVKPNGAEDVLSQRRLAGFPVGSWALKPPFEFLSDIIHKLVAFQPHLRFGSARELLSWLDRVLQNPDTKKIQDHGGLKSAPTDEPSGEPVDSVWREKLAGRLSDPVLRALLSSSGTYFKLRFFPENSVLCHEEESSFDVFILLHGSVRISRNQETLAEEGRVGSIMGEVAALIGKPRTATLTANEDTVCVLINGAELEQAARKLPALAVRIMKTLAQHLFERDQRN